MSNTLLMRLCQPQPTMQDLQAFHKRNAELRALIEQHIAGDMSIAMGPIMRELDDLILVLGQAAKRARKKELKNIKFSG